jgi:hypothetical protein
VNTEWIAARRGIDAIVGGLAAKWRHLIVPPSLDRHGTYAAHCRVTRADEYSAADFARRVKPAAELAASTAKDRARRAGLRGLHVSIAASRARSRAIDQAVIAGRCWPPQHTLMRAPVGRARGARPLGCRMRAARPVARVGDPGPDPDPDPEPSRRRASTAGSAS